MRALFVALAMLVAGCNAAPVAPTDQTPVDGAPSGPEAPRALTVMDDGVLAFGNCQDSPVGQACVLNIGDPTQPGAANIVHFPVEGASGAVRKATATATWDALTPVIDQIALRITLLQTCPDSCTTQSVLLETSGTSPLSIELADFEIPDGAWLGFSVTRAEFMDSGQRVSLLQPFHIEGIVDLADAEPAAEEAATAGSA